MHPVFGFLEHDGLRAGEHFIGHFHGVAAKLFAHLLANGGLVVVVGGQAVHEYGGRLCLCHQFSVYLIGGKRFNALGPHFNRLAHAYPHIGVYHIGVLYGIGVIAQGNGSAGFGGNGLALFHQLRGGPVCLGGAGNKVQAHLGAANHQGVAHVVAGIAHVSEFQPGQLAKVLFNRQKVSQNLGGVELIGQAIPYRYGGILGQLVHNLLAIAAVLNAVKHAAQHLGGVGNGFLFADLAARWIQIGGAHAQVVGSNLKGAAGAGRSFFKDQRNVFAAQYIVQNACLLFGFQLGGKVHQICNFFRGVIQKGQKISAFQVHGVFLLSIGILSRAKPGSIVMEYSLLWHSAPQNARKFLHKYSFTWHIYAAWCRQSPAI